MEGVYNLYVELLEIYYASNNCMDESVKIVRTKSATPTQSQIMVPIHCLHKFRQSKRHHVSMATRAAKGPVWDRDMQNRDAFKRNAALLSLLASRFSRRAVRFPAFSAARDRRTRVGRNPFGRIFLRFLLKSIADAVPNRAKDAWDSRYPAC